MGGDQWNRGPPPPRPPSAPATELQGNPNVAVYCGQHWCYLLLFGFFQPFLFHIFFFHLNHSLWCAQFQFYFTLVFCGSWVVDEV